MPTAPGLRPSGRAPDQLRELTLRPGVARHAEGSCLIRMGVTEVLCTASVEGRVPPFMRGKGEGRCATFIGDIAQTRNV